MINTYEILTGMSHLLSFPKSEAGKQHLLWKYSMAFQFLVDVPYDSKIPF